MTPLFQHPTGWPAPWRASVDTQVWELTERARQSCKQPPQDDASLGSWLVHAPWMAPVGAWHWHCVGLIHLRDLPGQSKPPVRTFDAATHELVAAAIDPQTSVDIGDSATWESLKLLSPLSIVQQFVAHSDVEALKRIEEGLLLCVEGRLTLDSDGCAGWRLLLGAA